MHFNENNFTCQCEEEDKMTQGFQMLHFYGSFSSDIMAVKGLIAKRMEMSVEFRI